MLRVYASLSLGVSVLVLLMIALKPLLKKRYSARWGYLAWIVLCVFLVIPIGKLMPQASHQLVIPLPDKIFDLNNLIPASVSGDAPSLLSNTSGEAVHAVTVHNSEATAKTQSIIAAPVPERTAGVQQNVKAKQIDPWSLVNLLWLAGIAAFLLYFGISYLMFLIYFRKVNKGQPNEETMTLYRQAEAAIGARRKAELLIVEGLPSPMLMGFFRPRVYLPKELVSCPGLELIFRHELVHLKRGDLYVKLMAVIANAIHWFNPLAYILRKRMDADCEFSCDERVLQGETIESRVCYGETVLSVMRGAIHQKSIFTTNFTAGKGTMRMRLHNILEGKSKKTGILALAALLLAAATISTIIVFADDEKQASFYGTIQVPSTVTKVDQKPYSVDLYIGDKLAGGAKVEAYNYSDPNGITIPGDCAEDSRVESKVNGFSAYDCILTSLTTGEPEHHIYAVDHDNAVVFEFYGIDSVVSSNLAQKLAKSWKYTAPNPLSLGEEYTWAKLDTEELTALHEAADQGPYKDASWEKRDALQFADQYMKNAGITAKYAGYSYAVKRFLNPYGIEYGGLVLRVYYDSDRCLEVFVIRPNGITYPAGVWAIVGYREIQPLETLPNLSPPTFENVKSSAVYREDEFGKLYNSDKAEEFIKKTEESTPAQLDYIVFAGSKIYIWQRLIYDGEKLYLVSFSARPEGGFNCYKDADLQKIEIESINATNFYNVTFDNGLSMEFFNSGFWFAREK